MNSFDWILVVTLFGVHKILVFNLRYSASVDQMNSSLPFQANSDFAVSMNSLEFKFKIKDLNVEQLSINLVIDKHEMQSSLNASIVSKSVDHCTSITEHVDQVDIEEANHYGISIMRFI